MGTAGSNRRVGGRFGVVATCLLLVREVLLAVCYSPAPSYQQRPLADHDARNALQRLTVYQVTQLLLIPKVLPHRYPEQLRLWLAQKFGAGPQITAISGSPWVPPATVEHDQPAPAISEPQNDIPTIPTSW